MYVDAEVVLLSTLTVLLLQMLAYEYAIISKTPDGKIRNMQKALDNNFTHPSLSHEANMVKNNILLLGK